MHGVRVIQYASLTRTNKHGGPLTSCQLFTNMNTISYTLTTHGCVTGWACWSASAFATCLGSHVHRRREVGTDLRGMCKQMTIYFARTHCDVLFMLVLACIAQHKFISLHVNCTGLIYNRSLNIVVPSVSGGESADWDSATAIMRHAECSSRC